MNSPRLAHMQRRTGRASGLRMVAFRHRSAASEEPLRRIFRTEMPSGHDGTGPPLTRSATAMVPTSSGPEAAAPAPPRQSHPAVASPRRPGTRARDHETVATEVRAQATSSPRRPHTGHPQRPRWPELQRGPGPDGPAGTERLRRHNRRAGRAATCAGHHGTSGAVVRICVVVAPRRAPSSPRSSAP
jgi:hypothetical protein